MAYFILQLEKILIATFYAIVGVCFERPPSYYCKGKLFTTLCNTQPGTRVFTNNFRFDTCHLPPHVAPGSEKPIYRYRMVPVPSVVQPATQQSPVGEANCLRKLETSINTHRRLTRPSHGGQSTVLAKQNIIIIMLKTTQPQHKRTSFATDLRTLADEKRNTFLLENNENPITHPHTHTYTRCIQ